MKENADILRDYVSDILVLENRILQSVERQTRDDRVKRQRDAYELLQRVESTLSGHTLALERHLASSNGGSESFIKRATATAVDVASAFYEKVRADEGVSKALSDDYTALSHAAISYSMLHAAALALEAPEVADLALRHLTELTPLVVALSRVIPNVVAEELSREGIGLAVSAGAEAAENTRKAWGHEYVD
jgi:ferritin-like metal-binding protein YciE